MIREPAHRYRIFIERVIFLKFNNKIYLLSIISFIVGFLLMEYLVRVFFVGMLIFFILIAFQTPTTKVDPTGEANEFSKNLLRFIGLNALLYVAGGYVSVLFF